MICHDCPGSRSAAAVTRLPDTATHSPGIGYDAAIDSRGRVDSYRVNSPLRRGIIETARTAGHSFWLRTECGEIRRTQRVWIGEFKLQMLARWDAGGHPCMLRGGGSQPCRIKTASRKCQTVAPILFQLAKISRFAP